MNSLSLKVLNKIFTEWPVLEKLNVNKIDGLVNGPVQMHKFRVDSFAIRTIDKTGQSSMFCTNVSWPMLIQNENFVNDFYKDKVEITYFMVTSEFP